MICCLRHLLLITTPSGGNSVRAVFAIVFASILLAAGATRVEYSPRNIDWGAVHESALERTQATVARPKFASAPTSGATQQVRNFETRTLTLESGCQIRVTEELVEDAPGVTNRVFASGEQLFELSVVSPIDCVDETLASLERANCRVIRRYGERGRILRVLVPKQGLDETDKVIASLSSLTGVSAARSPVNFNVPLAERAPLTTRPNDPLFPNQWALARASITNAWAKGYFGYPNVPCAVYDTGCHLSHEDLAINVHTRVSALNSDKDPEDHHGHGSHCLGIMGADTNNARGIAGVGQVANLTSIRGPISYWQEGDSILDGFQYALEQGIKIVSCSFGSYSYDGAEKALIDDMGRAGILLVVAAGNDGNDNDRVPTYPSSFDCENILSVIATNENDEPANVKVNGWATSFGENSTDIGAPGTDIFSCTRDADNAYEAWSGTSMATPLVAACAAILWEQNPSWGPLEIKRRLMNTADRLQTLIGYCRSGARVNLDRALDRSTGYVSVETLKEKCYDVGEEVTLEVYSSAVASLRAALTDREGNVRETKTFPVEATGLTRVGFALREDMIARGWYFKVEGLTQGGEAIDDVFAYSTRFRVKDPAHVETIEVKMTSVKPVDANSFKVAFTASDAEYVSCAIESWYTAEDLAEYGDEYEEGWYEDATVFYSERVTAKVEKSETLSLQGRGWLKGRYRLVVFDSDDPSIYGVSEEFSFDRSNGSVFFLPGEPKDRANPSAGGTDAWKSEYAAGETMRLSVYMPSTSLYWMYLVDEEADAIVFLKEIWINTALDSKWHAFDYAIPDQFVGRKNLYIYFYDAFTSELHDRTPYFDVAPRADGLVAPDLNTVLGDKSGAPFLTNGQWTSEYLDGEWVMKANWVGPGESAALEVLLSGPRKIDFEVMNSSAESSRGSLALEYAAYPVMKGSEWKRLATYGGSASGWQRPEVADLPKGDNWLVRWVWTRDEKDRWDENEPPLNLYVRNIRLAEKLDPLKLRINDKGVASINDMPLYPTCVYWTVDGSEPTKSARRWLTVLNSDYSQSSQRISFDRSVILKAKAFRDGYEPSDTAEVIRFVQRTDEAGAILISSVADLLAFSQAVSSGETFEGKTVKLTNDIDMSGFKYPTPGGEALRFAVWDAVNERTYYEARNRPFLGKFDGAGHAIFNLDIQPNWGETPSRYGAIGFLGMVGVGGELCDLTLVSPRVDVVGFVLTAGTFAGVNQGFIHDCRIYDPSFNVVGADWANVLVGHTDDVEGQKGTTDKKTVFVGESADAPKFVDSGAGTGMEYPSVTPPPAPKPEFYHVRAGWEPSYCSGQETVIVQAPMDSSFELRVPANGAWRVRYMTDGSEPTEASTPYLAPFVIPGTCVIKARTFADGYAASPISTIRCVLDIPEDERERYRAKLTVIGGKKLSGTYWLEDFTVRADPPAPRMRFSHWKVSGPLVLIDPSRSEITFRWQAGAGAVTLEAVYVRNIIPKVIFR